MMISESTEVLRTPSIVSVSLIELYFVNSFGVVERRKKNIMKPNSVRQGTMWPFSEMSNSNVDRGRQLYVAV